MSRFRLLSGKGDLTLFQVSQKAGANACVGFLTTGRHTAKTCRNTDHQGEHSPKVCTPKGSWLKLHNRAHTPRLGITSKCSWLK